MDSREPQLIIAEKPLGAAVEEVEPGWPLRAPVRLVRPIGQLLIEADLIGEGDLARALAFQERLRCFSRRHQPIRLPDRLVGRSGGFAVGS